MQPTAHFQIRLENYVMNSNEFVKVYLYESEKERQHEENIGVYTTLYVIEINKEMQFDAMRSDANNTHDGMNNMHIFSIANLTFK